MKWLILFLAWLVVVAIVQQARWLWTRYRREMAQGKADLLATVHRAQHQYTAFNVTRARLHYGIPCAQVSCPCHTGARSEWERMADKIVP